MNMIRTILWVLVTAALVIFAMANWDPVSVKIWPGQSEADAIILDTKLPAVILISFLVGFLPTWLAWRASRWTMGRRLESSERQLADLRARASRANEPAAPATLPDAIPPSTGQQGLS